MSMLCVYSPVPPQVINLGWPVPPGTPTSITPVPDYNIGKTSLCKPQSLMAFYPFSVTHLLKFSFFLHLIVYHEPRSLMITASWESLKNTEQSYQQPPSYY